MEQRFEDTLIRRDYSLAYHSRQIEVSVRMDVRMKHRQIKFCFPVAAAKGIPVYSMPYCFVKKQPDGLEEPAQQWAAVEDGGKAYFAVLNDGKYSFSMKGDTFRMTAVRTPAYADHFGNRDDLMEYTDQGVGEFRYALLPCPGGYGEIVRAARLFNQPPEAIVETYHHGPLPALWRGIEVSDDHVVAEVFKRAEDGGGHVLRLFDASGEGAGEVAVRCAGREASLTLVPQEIRTILLPDDETQPVRECLITELE